MEPLRRLVVCSAQLSRRLSMADLIFLVLATGLFVAFAAFATALRRL
jgi:hypothetical protein